MSKLVGKWVLVSTDSLDPIMVSMGVDDEWRKKSVFLEFTDERAAIEEFAVEGDVVTLRLIVSGVVVKTTKMPVNQEIDETALDERPCKTILQLEGDAKSIRTEKGPNYEVIYTRVISGDEMAMTITGPGGARCNRKYKKIQ